MPPKKLTSSTISSSSGTMLNVLKKTEHNNTTPDTTASEVLSSVLAGHQRASGNVCEPHLLFPSGDPHQPRYKAYPVAKYNRHFRNTWYDKFKHNLDT